jgi:FtsH-binding integral membrane protein
MSAVLRPRFYLLVTAALVAFVVVGFTRTYYSRILTDPPPLTTLLHLHAAVFTVWMALFLTQAGLVAAHRVDLHRRLGIASAIFAGVVFVVAVLAVFQTAISNHFSPSGLAPPQFSIIGFTSAGLFGAFIALGLIYRRRPGLHRRFMILGFIASISAATARVARLLDIQEYRDVFIPLCAALFITACLVYDWRKYRVVHPAYVIGGLVIVASWPLRNMVGHSDWYFPIGEAVARIAHGMFG